MTCFTRCLWVAAKREGIAKQSLCQPSETPANVPATMSCRASDLLSQDSCRSTIELASSSDVIQEEEDTTRLSSVIALVYEGHLLLYHCKLIGS